MPFKDKISLVIKVCCSRSVRRESQLSGEIQTQLSSHVGVIDIGQDVPHIFAVALHVAQIQWYGDGSMRHVNLAGVQQLNRPDQAAIGGGGRRSKVRQRDTRADGRGRRKYVAPGAGADGSWTGSLVRVECS